MAGTPIAALPITGAFTFPIFGAESSPKQVYIGPPPQGLLRVVDVDTSVSKTDAERFALLQEAHMVLLERQNIIAKKLKRAELKGDLELTEKLEERLLRAIDFTKSTQAEFAETVRDLNNQLPHGAYTVLMETGWNAAVENVHRNNPGFAVSMLPVFNATTRILPNDEKLKRLQLDLLQEPIQQTGSFSGKQQYTVSMTPYLSCMVKFPEIMLGPSKRTTFAAYTSYEHKQMVFIKGTAKYTLNSVYDYFREKIVEGGFLDTSTEETIRESLKSTKVIEVELIDEDQYPDDQKAILRDELRKFAFADAVAGLAAVVPEGTEPPENAASVAADELMKTCGATSIYCAGAAAALKVLSAFGSSSQTESLIKTMSDVRTMSFTEGRTIQIPAAVTYAEFG